MLVGFELNFWYIDIHCATNYLFELQPDIFHIFEFKAATKVTVHEMVTQTFPIGFFVVKNSFRLGAIDVPRANINIEGHREVV